MANFATIAGHTIDVAKIIDIDWAPVAEDYYPLSIPEGGAAIILPRNIIVITAEQAAAFRWYMGRIWKPVDVEAAHHDWIKHAPTAQPQ